MKPGETVLYDGKLSRAGSINVHCAEEVPQVAHASRSGRAPEAHARRARVIPHALQEGGAYPKHVYASDDEYFAAISAAYRAELAILYRAGLRNVQINDPNFACT